MKFEIVNPEIETADVCSYDIYDMVVFTLKTPLGEREECAEYINIDEDGNKTVERIDSNLHCNLYDEIDALFNFDIPWDEIYDALDAFLSVSEENESL